VKEGDVTRRKLFQENQKEGGTLGQQTRPKVRIIKGMNQKEKSTLGVRGGNHREKGETVDQT